MKTLLVILLIYVILDIATSIAFIIRAKQNGYTLRGLAIMLRSVLFEPNPYDDWGDDYEDEDNIEDVDYEDVTDEPIDEGDDGYIVENSDGSN